MTGSLNFLTKRILAKVRCYKLRFMPESRAGWTANWCGRPRSHGASSTTPCSSSHPASSCPHTSPGGWAGSQKLCTQRLNIAKGTTNSRAECPLKRNCLFVIPQVEKCSASVSWADYSPKIQPHNLDQPHPQNLNQKLIPEYWPNFADHSSLSQVRSLTSIQQQSSSARDNSDKSQQLESHQHMTNSLLF